MDFIIVVVVAVAGLLAWKKWGHIVMKKVNKGTSKTTSSITTGGATKTQSLDKK